jgi:hypothetical protein
VRRERPSELPPRDEAFHISSGRDRYIQVGLSVWNNGGMVSPTRTIEANDHETGSVVGTVTVPVFADADSGKRPWGISWNCMAPDCGVRGAVDHNETPGDAYTALMTHCWGDHGIIVLPRDLGVK